MDNLAHSGHPVRLFWTDDELPGGTVTFWRGDRRQGVREVDYVPADQLAGAVEALERIVALRDGKPVLDQVGMYQVATDALDHIGGQ
jgi:hypothetical protein